MPLIYQHTIIKERRWLKVKFAQNKAKIAGIAWESENLPLKLLKSPLTSVQLFKNGSK